MSTYYTILDKKYQIEQPPKNYTSYISIDPGIKNLAFRYEKRYPDKIEVPIFKIITVDETRYTESITELFDELNIDTPDFVIIEKQQNPKAKCIMLHIFQHIISYFYFRFEKYHTKIIILSPKAKRKIFPTIVGKAKKKEAIIVAETFTEIPKCKKKDDLADTVCQLEAFIRLYNN